MVQHYAMRIGYSRRGGGDFHPVETLYKVIMIVISNVDTG